MKNLKDLILEKLRISNSTKTKFPISITPPLFNFTDEHWGGVDYCGELVGFYELGDYDNGTKSFTLFVPKEIQNEFIDENYVPDNSKHVFGNRPVKELYNYVKGEHPKVTHDLCYIENFELFLDSRFPGTLETPYGAKHDKGEFMDLIEFCTNVLKQTNDVSINDKSISLDPEDYEWF